jgi:iron complex transport system substrate-binding protein
MRICSLLPSATEIVFALGSGPEVVGVTHECDYPPEAKTKPIVVRGIIDSETLSSAEIDRAVREQLQGQRSLYTIDPAHFGDAAPDVVLTQELCSVCAVDYREVVAQSKLLPREPKIISLNPHTLTDVLDDVARVAEATGREAEGALVLRELRERIERAREPVSSSKQCPRVVCLEWLDPLYCGGHWIPEMVELAGGQDGFGEKGKPSMQVEWTSILEFAPEIIVLMPCGFDVDRTIKDCELLKRREGWHSLPAVQSGRVFAVNGHAYFSRPGPRLVDGLEILAQILHPEIFAWQANADQARSLA